MAQVRDGVIVLIPQHGDVVEQMRGLHSEIWDIDIDQYINEERDSWDSPNRS